MSEDQNSVLERLGQVEAEGVGRVFREYMRGGSREMLTKVMTDEVEFLCSPAYRLDPEARCYRSMTAAGYTNKISRREVVQRSRARQRTEEGTTEEAQLHRYRAAQDPREAHRLLIEAMLAAGSARRVGRLVDDQRGSSCSQLSRLRREVGREKFAELRHRSLAENEKVGPRDWLALMLDAIELAADGSVIRRGSCTA